MSAFQLNVIAPRLILENNRGVMFVPIMCAFHITWEVERRLNELIKSPSAICP